MSSCYLFHHHHLLFPSPNLHHDIRYFKVESIRPISDSSIRFRTLPKFSSRQNPSTSSPEVPIEKPEFESQIALEDDENPDPYLPSGSTSFKPLLSFIQGFREKLKFDELGMDIMSIALPAVLALAAEPITSLVDTAFVGHLVFIPWDLYHVTLRLTVGKTSSRPAGGLELGDQWGANLRADQLSYPFRLNLYYHSPICI